MKLDACDKMKELSRLLLSVFETWDGKSLPQTLVSNHIAYDTLQVFLILIRANYFSFKKVWNFFTNDFSVRHNVTWVSIKPWFMKCPVKQSFMWYTQYKKMPNWQVYGVSEGMNVPNSTGNVKCTKKLSQQVPISFGFSIQSGTLDVARYRFVYQLEEMQLRSLLKSSINLEQKIDSVFHGESCDWNFWAWK